MQFVITSTEMGKQFTQGLNIMQNAKPQWALQTKVYYSNIDGQLVKTKAYVMKIEKTKTKQENIDKSIIAIAIMNSIHKQSKFKPQNNMHMQNVIT